MQRLETGESKPISQKEGTLPAPRNDVLTRAEAEYPGDPASFAGAARGQCHGE
jgi:hypothetical protein